MHDLGRYHSSGKFTLDLEVQSAHLGSSLLQDVAQVPLRLIQIVVGLKATSLSLRLSRQRVIARFRRSSFENAVYALEPLEAHWGLRREQQYAQIVEWTWKRSISKQQLHCERQWLERLACFCPIAVKLNGYILQPENFIWNRPAEPMLPQDYHLAECLYPGPGPGLSLFRPDGDKVGHINTCHTFWRDKQAGVEALQWWMPWRVAGQVARLKSCSGWRLGWAGLLAAQPGVPSQGIALHNGVVVWTSRLNWPELPGLCLLFDASDLKVDLSGLKLLENPDLRERLSYYRTVLLQRLSHHLLSWLKTRRSDGLISRQNHKEAKWLFSIWSISVMSGMAVYLPLPLLGLPWICWHHYSRKRIYKLWLERLHELNSGENGMS